MKRFRREVVRRDVLLSFDFWSAHSRLPSFFEGFSPLVDFSEQSWFCVLLVVTPGTLISSNSIVPIEKIIFNFNYNEYERNLYKFINWKFNFDIYSAKPEKLRQDHLEKENKSS